MIFLSKRFVLAYHTRLINVFGGSQGIRDAGLLKSALAAPESTVDGVYPHADLWEMAAAYAFHLIKNHPFVDGNKRIAAVAMGTFLDVNGAPLRVDEVELYDRMIALASDGIGKADLAAWLRERAPQVGPTHEGQRGETTATFCAHISGTRPPGRSLRGRQSKRALYFAAPAKLNIST